MKAKILPLICLTLLFGCSTEQIPEPVTEIGWFTPSTLAPEYIKGQAASVELNSFWVNEADGEYIIGDPVSKKERDSFCR